MKPFAFAAVFVLCASLAHAQAQPPAGAGAAVQPPQLPQSTPDKPIGPGEIQRLFDAYIVYHAQEALQLSDAQYGQFVTRLKQLQNTRRRHQQTRNQILADLRRLTNPESQAKDDTVISERIRALRDAEERAAAEVRKAYDGVDEALDVRQQARFRLFEERMEQQKLELVMRARQAARARNGRQ
jgi:hypothetical protein